VGGVIFTGTGANNAEGLFVVKQNEARIFAQVKESRVVFRMPKEAIKLNAIPEILLLHKISSRIINFCAQATENP
jgi:two-component system chemotaxis response regulator CheB